MIGSLGFSKTPQTHKIRMGMDLRNHFTNSAGEPGFDADHQPMISFAIIARATAPGPWPKAMGTIATSITVDNRIGRRRVLFAPRMDWYRSRPCLRN